MIELLLRMPGVDGELIDAGQFMPAAERFGLAPRVDRWVLKNALAWLSSAQERLPGLSTVNINVSAQSLGDDRFPAFVIDLLEHYPLRQTRLCFEITETAIMTRPRASLAIMQDLREHDIEFAMDDFGAGYSSLALLQELPISQLKIDGRLVGQALAGERERRLLCELNDLGKVLNQSTVAEMVESEALRTLVAKCGIDYVQGWVIGRPQPLTRLPAAVLDRAGPAGSFS